MKDYFNSTSYSEGKKIKQELKDSFTEDVRKDVDEIRIAIKGIIEDIYALESKTQSLERVTNELRKLIQRLSDDDSVDKYVMELLKEIEIMACRRNYN